MLFMHSKTLVTFFSPKLCSTFQIAPALFCHLFNQPSRDFASANRRNESDNSKVISRLTGKKTTLWDLYNEVVYPPTLSATEDVLPRSESSTLRPAEVTYEKASILYSRKKLWLLAFMIRGLSVDEAFQQLGFRVEKGARILEQALETAIDKAVQQQDIEFCTELWVETAQVLRGISVPCVHKGLRTNISNNNYHYANLKLRLREGQPPAIYHPYRIRNAWIPASNCPAGVGKPGWGTPQDILEIELRKLRRRRIPGDL